VTFRNITVPILSILLLSILGLSVKANAEVCSLSFVHTHTGERIAVNFKKDGAYVPEAIDKLDHFLRDFRNRKMHDIDPKLFDILFEIQQRAGVKGPFYIISCYRSPETNEMLRRTTTGVAKNSMHTRGRAIDVRLPGVDTAVLRDIALKLKEGGVGYYEKSNFIHVDTGRVRRW
jgi:uncharacterized protein YcbK (DUF882 family)